MEEKKNALADALASKKGAPQEEGIKRLLGQEEKALDKLLEQTKSKMDTSAHLNKAHKHELENDYKRALESYLKYVEARLSELHAQKQSTILDYLSLVRYYLKIAECFEKITHTTAGGKTIDMENAGEYYTRAAKMYSQMDKFDEAYKAYEDAARCYADVDSYSKAANSYIDAGLMHYGLHSTLMACSSFIKAAEFYEKGEEYDKASTAYLKAADLNLEIKDIYGAMTCYKKAGECYDKMSESKEAIKYYIKSAELSSTVERYTEVAARYEGIAKSYEKLEDYKNAIFYHLHAAELNKGNDDLAASYCFDNAAICYAKMNDYVQAIEHYKKSVKIRVNIKKFAEAAAASKEIAGYYEKLSDPENSARAYFQYSDLDASAKQQGIGDEKGTSEGYEKAANIFVDLANKSITDNYEKGIKNYQEAARCYDRLGDNKTAAELYVKMAEMEMEKNYDNAIKFYTDAAARYSKMGEHIKAATCYVFAKDYLNAARNYSSYAENNLKKGALFQAGKGYRMAGDAYMKLKKPYDMKEAYSKAIHIFLQYLEKAQYTKLLDKSMTPGIANKTIGECYIELEDSPHAQKHLAAALSYFKENNEENEVTVTEALSRIVDADLALKSGDYPKATKMLQETVTLLDTSIKTGGWPGEYTDFLQHNLDKVKEILQKINVKPDIELVMEQPISAVPMGKIIIIGRITNNGTYPIKNPYLMPSAPQEFRITKDPAPIEEIPPGQIGEISYEAEVRDKGTYKFAPLEILYKDKDGNKYMRASNEITVEVV